MAGVLAMRQRFPALAQASRVSLDNAATTWPLGAALDAFVEVARSQRSRAQVGELVADARARVAQHLGTTPAQVVFCASATQAIDLVATGWAATQLRAQDEILLSTAEHVAHVAPWQRLARQGDLRVSLLPVAGRGVLAPDTLRAALTPRTRLVALTHIGNVAGNDASLRELVAIVRDAGAVSVVDGAQAIARRDIAFDTLGADFYAFSGHKAYAPGGVGVLVARSERLAQLQPALLGANALQAWDAQAPAWWPAPGRFEGGALNVAGIVALARALDGLREIGFDAIAAHEAALGAQLVAGLAGLPALHRVFATGPDAGVHTFALAQGDAASVQAALAARGIDVAAGEFATRPLLQQFGVPALLRASFALYNDPGDVDRLLTALREVLA